MNKKPRNKKYTPRPIGTAGGLVAIARATMRRQEAVPLREDQTTDLGLAYWLSMQNLLTGDANEEAWSCVVCALNIGMALSENGIGADAEPWLVKALDGAFRAKIRSARTGNFRFDGEAITAITDALHAHDEQMKLATRAEVTEAMNLVRRRIDEGHVYREAANQEHKEAA